MLKRRDELARLPEWERWRYCALLFWGSAVLGVLLALQFAFVEGFPGVGLIVAAPAALCVVPALVFTRRAVRAHRTQEREGPGEDRERRS